MGRVLSCGRSNKRVSANLVVRIYSPILVKSKIHCTIPMGRHPFKSGHFKKKSVDKCEIRFSQEFN